MSPSNLEAEQHELIVENVRRLIGSTAQAQPCVVHPRKLRIQVDGHYTYSDVAVTSGEPKFLDPEPVRLLNPTLIVEVTTPWTEAFDRGLKFERYHSIESLRDLVLIATDRISVFVFRRCSKNSWLLKLALCLEESVELQSVECCLSVADIYSGLVFAGQSAADIADSAPEPACGSQ